MPRFVSVHPELGNLPPESLEPVHANTGGYFLQRACANALDALKDLGKSI